MAPPSVYPKSVVRTYWRTTSNDVHVPAQNRNICQKIAKKRSKGCHFGRNAYPFRPKLISLSAETEVLLHRKKVTRRLKLNRTSNLNRQKTWNYSDFSPMHKFHFVLQSPIDIVCTKKREKATTTNCVIVAFSQILYPIYRSLLCHSRNRYAVPCRLREYRTYATSLGSDT